MKLLLSLLQTLTFHIFLPGETPLSNAAFGGGLGRILLDGMGWIVLSMRQHFGSALILELRLTIVFILKVQASGVKVCC